MAAEKIRCEVVLFHSLFHLNYNTAMIPYFHSLNSLFYYTTFIYSLFFFIRNGNLRENVRLKREELKEQKEMAIFAKRIAVSFWLRNRDSNPNKQSQSLSCYRYTIPQYIRSVIIITQFSALSSIFFKTAVFLFIRKQKILIEKFNCEKWKKKIDILRPKIYNYKAVMLIRLSRCGSVW